LFFLSPAPSGVSDTYWRSLRYFNLYRLLSATLLLVASYFHPGSFELLPATDRPLYMWTALLYCLAAMAGVFVLGERRGRFNLQLSVQVLLDISALTVMMHASGGFRGGLGAMLLVSLAGAGLVGQGRLVLFYAALASLAVLFQQLLLALGSEFDASAFFQTGLLCVGFFASAITARLLARRVVANEELARRRGDALANQMAISQRVIEEMQDGVLVVTPQGDIRLHNPRAEHLLGRPDSASEQLLDYSPLLDAHFRQWCLQQGRDESGLVFHVPGTGKQVFARFIDTPSTEGDTLILLEDMERLRAEAQQLKLAALGRLTANIAHEIRNPLSAINHAGELLQEEAAPGSGDARLLRIILDNAQRLERIVRDVLELGRRDRCHPETIPLEEVLLLFVDEFRQKEAVTEDVVRLEFAQVGLTLQFDRAHLHQVLWNLLSNALRHSRRGGASVRLSVLPASGGQVELHVMDDGSGVPEGMRDQIFEPFFTTHSQGTGLGLHIARELCEANGARLELVDDTAAGAHFRLTGRSV